jgi:glycerol-3-phosphate O-acyltransferase
VKSLSSLAVCGVVCLSVLHPIVHAQEAQARQLVYCSVMAETFTQGNDIWAEHQQLYWTAAQALSSSAFVESEKPIAQRLFRTRLDELIRDRKMSNADKAHIAETMPYLKDCTAIVKANLMLISDSVKSQAPQPRTSAQ